MMLRLALYLSLAILVSAQKSHADSKTFATGDDLYKSDPIGEVFFYTQAEAEAVLQPATGNNSGTAVWSLINQWNVNALRSTGVFAPAVVEAECPNNVPTQTLKSNLSVLAELLAYMPAAGNPNARSTAVNLAGIANAADIRWMGTASPNDRALMFKLDPRLNCRITVIAGMGTQDETQSTKNRKFNALSALMKLAGSDQPWANDIAATNGTVERPSRLFGLRPRAAGNDMSNDIYVTISSFRAIRAFASSPRFLDLFAMVDNQNVLITSHSRGNLWTNLMWILGEGMIDKSSLPAGTVLTLGQIAETSWYAPRLLSVSGISYAPAVALEASYLNAFRPSNLAEGLAVRPNYSFVGYQNQNVQAPQENPNGGWSDGVPALGTSAWAGSFWFTDMSNPATDSNAPFATAVVAYRGFRPAGISYTKPMSSWGDPGGKDPGVAPDSGPANTSWGTYFGVASAPWMLATLPHTFFSGYAPCALAKTGFSKQAFYDQWVQWQTLGQNSLDPATLAAIKGVSGKPGRLQPVAYSGDTSPWVWVMMYAQYAIESFEKCDGNYPAWEAAVWARGGAKVVVPNVNYSATLRQTTISESAYGLGDYGVYWLDFSVPAAPSAAPSTAPAVAVGPKVPATPTATPGAIGGTLPSVSSFIGPRPTTGP